MSTAFGFLEVALDKPRCRPGDAVRGVIRFNLREPVKGKALYVGLRATEPPGKVLHVEQHELHGRAEYLRGERRFEVMVPARPPSPSAPRTKLTWEVFTRIDRGWRADLTAATKLTLVRPKAASTAPKKRAAPKKGAKPKRRAQK